MAPIAVDRPTELACESYLTAADFQRRLERMDDQSLFEILGVSPTASTEAIERSYLKQLFIWHPDRLGPHQAALRPLANRICGRLNAAYQQLRDPLRRAQHRHEIEQKLGTPKQRDAMAALTRAASLAEHAQVLLRHRRLEEARHALERAIALDPEPALYRVLLAWVQAEEMGPPPERARGETTDRYCAQLAVFDREIAADPHFERARYFRGELLKRSGYLEEAIEDFRIAAKLNPRNIGAAREVRLYAMRQARRSWLERVFGTGKARRRQRRR